MCAYSSSKQALIPLLNQLYEKIRSIEIEQQLWAGANDYRPRIEIFHDAIRAFTSGVSPYDPDSRLAINWLAKDIENLRAIQSNPLAKMPHAIHHSASTQLTISKPPDAAARRQQSRQARRELADLYQQYAVMFVALLAESADMNHQALMEEQDIIVEDLARLQQAIAGKKKVDLRKEAQTILDDLGIIQQLPRGYIDATEASNSIKNLQNNADNIQQHLEQAHTIWLAGQLAFYQEGKTVVKKLMQQGMHIAGRFLQDAFSRGHSGPGRGY